MLSVLIETRNDEEALARTLASLIGGAVEGVVREVIVCDRGSTDQTHYVAEHAGCHFLAEGGIAAGIAQAKGDWLLMLEPGARLVEGWIDDVVQHAAKQTMAARFSRSRRRAHAFPGARVLGGRRARRGTADHQAAGGGAVQNRRQRRGNRARPGDQAACGGDRCRAAERVKPSCRRRASDARPAAA